MNVFDASALLAFLQGEAGADLVEEALLSAPGLCLAVNWSEVMQKVLAADRSWPQARALLLAYGLTVEPVTRADAELAASAWLSQPALSLADRLCLAASTQRDLPVWTADRGWGTDGNVRQIR